jgi:hypothetical protein
MRRIILALAFPLALASCSEGVDAPTATPQANNGTVDAATMAEVLRLVREFSDDVRASVSSLKQDDSIVCGTARVRGESVRFYVDLVDEEAFLDSDNPGVDALIRAACS